MSKVDWSLAPEDATHYNEINDMFYKLVGSEYYFYEADNETIVRGGDKSRYQCGFIERPKQPKAWSGPEDGLPPVGAVCEYRLAPSDVWHECEIRYHMTPAHDDSPRAIVWNEFLGFDQISGSNWHFRAIPTHAQIRESAIRELMDIAQVDCRVTAARLVDAGFKR